MKRFPHKFTNETSWPCILAFWPVLLLLYLWLFFWGLHSLFVIWHIPEKVFSLNPYVPLVIPKNKYIGKYEQLTLLDLACGQLVDLGADNAYISSIFIKTAQIFLVKADFNFHFVTLHYFQITVFFIWKKIQKGQTSFLPKNSSQVTKF